MKILLFSALYPNLECFVPEGRTQVRQRLDLPQQGRYLLSVGDWVGRKGHHIAIEALPELPGVTLLIAGSYSEEVALKVLAERLGVTDRVHWAGVVPQSELKWWYSAADVVALSSSREDWANVPLESMACGTPVVVADIWGTPEVVGAPAAGVLMACRDAQSLAAAWRQLHDRLPTRGQTRARAETFSWDATTKGQLQLFRRVVDAKA